MNQALNQLLQLLQPEQTGEGRFIGQSEDIGLPRVFGGQLVGQGLYAAQQTVCPSRSVHSLQVCFLRPAQHQPIQYQVDILRDGQSFSTRRVEAWQQNKNLITMIASFQVSEAGFEYQQPVPVVPAVDLPVLRPEKHKPLSALEIRPVPVIEPVNSDTLALQQTWLRTSEPLPERYSLLQQCLLAYISDSYFLTTALRPHGLNIRQPGVQVATITHSLWFYQPFSLNDWLLYHVVCPITRAGRGLVRGEFYSTDGKLIACSAQEGVIRHWDKEK